MSCDYCNLKPIDLHLLTLPCGYSVCYSHLKTQEESFECFICNDHTIDKQSSFKTIKNRKKMEKISILEEQKQILNLCDQ
ncbi:hypothetical protein BpHYR1_039661, partial [Brachionus plicatilis]